MVSIDYFVNELRSRKVIFDESVLLDMVFDDSIEAVESAGDEKNDFNIAMVMKHYLLSMVRVADVMYGGCGCLIGLELDDDYWSMMPIDSESADFSL